MDKKTENFESFVEQEENMGGNYIPDHDKVNRKVVIPEGTKVIPKKQFYNQMDILTVEMPDSVEEIGEQAFASCFNLENIKFSKNLKKIGNLAFFSDNYLKNIILPNYVTSLGIECFSTCCNRGEKVRKVRLSPSLKFIPEKCFQDCGMDEIYIYDRVEKIGRKAFGDCIDLQKIRLPDNLKIIESKAFEYCAFKALEIPSWVTYIGSEAFADCSKLEEILLKCDIRWSHFFNKSEDIFYGCKSLKKVYCSEIGFKETQEFFEDAPQVEVIEVGMGETFRIEREWAEKGIAYSHDYIEPYPKF